MEISTQCFWRHILSKNTELNTLTFDIWRFIFYMWYKVILVTLSIAPNVMWKWWNILQIIEWSKISPHFNRDLHCNTLQHLSKKTVRKQDCIPQIYLETSQFLFFINATILVLSIHVSFTTKEAWNSHNVQKMTILLEEIHCNPHRLSCMALFSSVLHSFEMTA